MSPLPLFLPLSLGAAFSLQTALWWGWVVGAALGGAATLAWLYRRLFQLYPRRQAMTLLVLKIAAVVVLLLGLLKPALMHEERDLSNARVILLVDDSRSMSTHDGNLGEPRIEAAKRIAFEKVIARLNNKLLVTPLSFSDSIRALAKPDELHGAGEGTDIPNALLESAKNYAGAGSIGAYILVTDGGDSPALPAAFSTTAPVFSIAIGTDLSKADDLRIDQTECPARVDSKTDFDLTVEVAATGRPEFLSSLSSLKLTLSEGANTVATQNVALSAAAHRQSIKFRVASPEAGIHRYTLKLPLMKTEVASLNNERTFTVEVQDPSRRILYYASKLGQGYKPLRNALKPDPGVQFTSLVRVGADRFLLQGQRPDDNFTNEFPTTVEPLQKFKCIVVADCEAKDLSPAAQKALEQYVSTGGSLVLLGGPQAFGQGGWAETPMAPVFPWQIAASEPAFHNDKIAIELTPQGRAHPLFRDLANELVAGGTLATMSGYNTPGPLRPGTQGLIQAAVPSGERPAVVAVGHYGKGKVLGIATHPLWLWSNAEAEGGKAYSAFWRQTVRFMTGVDESGGLLSLNADKQGRYLPGSRAQITAHVLDRTLKPLKGAGLNGTLKRLDGSLVGAVNFREDGPPGAYSAQADLLSAGAYRLQVSASDLKGILETRELLLEAGAGTGEGANLAVNMTYLQALATKSGGAAMPAEQADELIDKVLQGVKTEVRRKEVSLLWDSPYYFMLFLGLMTCEWVARRRMNMI